WASPVAPTAAFFMPTTRLGSQYHDDLFVSTYKDGRILDFNLSPSRKTLILTGPLADEVADNTGNLDDEQSQIDFASGLGSITDVTTGPGGMYVLAYDSGTVYRITTRTSAMSIAGVLVPEPGSSAMIFCGLIVTWVSGLCRRRSHGPEARVTMNNNSYLAG